MGLVSKDEPIRQSYAMRLLYECPAVVAQNIDDPRSRKVTKKMKDGSTVHSMVFGGAPLHTIQAKKKDGTRATDFRSPAAAEEAKAVAENGYIPVFAHELPKLEEAAAALRSQLAAFGLKPEQCEIEQSREWVTPEGIKAAGTPDIRMCGDVWITGDAKYGDTANPIKVIRKVFDMGYDIQAAAYEEEARQNGWQGRYMHVLINGENAAPFCTTVLPLRESFLQLGRMRWAAAKAIWKKCMQEDHWPEYKSHEIGPDVWMLSRWQEHADTLSRIYGISF